MFVMGYHLPLSVMGIGVKDHNTIACSIDPVCLEVTVANKVTNDNKIFVYLFIDPILS